MHRMLPVYDFVSSITLEQCNPQMHSFHPMGEKFCTQPNGLQNARDRCISKQLHRIRFHTHLLLLVFVAAIFNSLWRIQR